MSPNMAYLSLIYLRWCSIQNRNPRKSGPLLQLKATGGVLNQKKLRERYVTNMRAYTTELIANERCLLGIRQGNV